MRTVLYGIVGIVVFFGLIQLIPYGKDHTNPPVAQDAPWPDPQTRDIAVRACYDCHSNQTTWMWYSSVAPFSWLIQRDVDEGRQRLNFSQWGGGRRNIREAAQTVADGSMPRWFYIPLHPSANLSTADRAKLIQGLEALGSAPPGTRQRGGEGE